jgi:hypothetical protein
MVNDLPAVGIDELGPDRVVLRVELSPAQWRALEALPRPARFGNTAALEAALGRLLRGPGH